ncbi:hypothetical protein D3C74_410900 [compost metagenome]
MLSAQRQGNLAFRPRIFHGIVQQNHDNLLDLLAVALNGQIGLNLIFQRDIFLEDDGLHGQDDILNRFADVEGGMNHAGAGIIHFRQIEQIIRQLRHPLRLRFDIVQPFGLVENGVFLIG